MSGTHNKQGWGSLHDGRHTTCPVEVAVVEQLCHLFRSAVARCVELLVHKVKQSLDVLCVVSLDHALGKLGIIVEVVKEAVELLDLSFERRAVQQTCLERQRLKSAYRFVVLLGLLLEVLVDKVCRVELAHVALRYCNTISCVSSAAGDILPIC